MASSLTGSQSPCVRFFICGYVKERIMWVFRTLTPQMLQKGLKKSSELAEMCHQHGGMHFENCTVKSSIN